MTKCDIHPKMLKIRIPNMGPGDVLCVGERMGQQRRATKQTNTQKWKKYLKVKRKHWYQKKDTNIKSKMLILDLELYLNL